MPTLQTRINAGRLLLTEAAAGDGYLLSAANQWRDFIRMGDNILEAVQQVADAAVAASEAEDRLSARRANADVGAGVRQVTNVGGKAYGHFAGGREALYEYARLFGVPTKRASAGPAKKPVNIQTLSDDELRKELTAGASKLGPAISKMLDLGARSQKSMRDGAVLSVQAGEDLPPEIVQKVVEQGLDFRDSVSIALFARVNGVMRRSAELSRRAWELMMMEDKSGWSSPWAHDPEFGDLELV